MTDPATTPYLGEWKLRFGDPDALGWATTAAYFLAAILCALAGRRERRSADSSARPMLWFALAAGLVFLGVNKQLDLQILIRDIGLSLVRAAGFDEQRRWVGRSFVVVVGVVGLIAFAFGLRYLGRAWKRHKLLLLGVALLGCFLVLRTGMYVPVLRQMNERHGWVMHVGLELASLVLICVAAISRMKNEK